MIKILLKYVYNRVYQYTVQCQLQFFRIYLKKYIKKHTKFRKKNPIEYKSLVTYNIHHEEEFQYINYLLEENLEDIIRMLCDFINRINNVSKSSYDGKCFVDWDRDVLITSITDRLYLVVNPTKFTFDIEAVLYDLVLYSFAHYNTFHLSIITAKTKIHEHLVSRLPVFVMFVTILMLLKTIELYIDKNMEFFWIKLSIMGVAFATSIYLVYLRVYQSIRADTKRLASDVYIKYKYRLYQKMLEKYYNYGAPEYYAKIFGNMDAQNDSVINDLL